MFWQDCRPSRSSWPVGGFLIRPIAFGERGVVGSVVQGVAPRTACPMLRSPEKDRTSLVLSFQGVRQCEYSVPRALPSLFYTSPFFFDPGRLKSRFGMQNSRVPPGCKRPSLAMFPAVNCWAIIRRPSGTEHGKCTCVEQRGRFPWLPNHGPSGRRCRSSMSSGLIPARSRHIHSPEPPMMGNEFLVGRGPMRRGENVIGTTKK